MAWAAAVNAAAAAPSLRYGGIAVVARIVAPLEREQRFVGIVELGWFGFIARSLLTVFIVVILSVR